MRSALKIGPVLLGFALALVGCASGSGGSSTSAPVGEVAPWNQERVTALAKELVGATDEVQSQLRSQPSPTVGSGQWASFYRLQQHVRRIRTEARHFASALKEGKGQAETLPIYQGLSEMVNDAAENARKIFVQEPLIDALTSAGSLLNRIAPYYDPRSYDGR